jgi:predicted CoA-substrate-specific enzyme activase
MIAAGIDVGSTSTKVVLLDNEKMCCKVKPTGWSPRQAGRECFQELLEQEGYRDEQVDIIVATGYGRVSLDFAHKAVTEITCHGRGAAFLVPGTDLVMDIGGQDSKVIKIDEKGKVLDFAMNDKCAAGTGRFLQVMAIALGLDVSELSELSRDHTPVTINNMCTVFAESEIIGLLAQGVEKGKIVAGIHASIARRMAAMANRMGTNGIVTFTGGVALNDGVRRSLENELGRKIVVPRDCQLVGAIGAALIGREILCHKLISN